MSSKNTRWMAGGAGLVLALFIGCGERSGEKEYNKALSAWKDGDLVHARTLFEKSIRKTSGGEKKSVALNQLGLVLWQLGEAEAAADAFTKSAALTETLSGASLNMGIALFRAGRMDEAEVALNNVLGEEANNASALAILGLIEARQRNWDAATRQISKAVSAKPGDPASQNALALAELHSNRNADVAIKRLQQVLSAYPDYAPAAYNLAVIYDQWQSNKSAALDWYKQYLQKAGPQASRAEAATSAIARLGETPATRTATTNPDAALRFMEEGSRLQSQNRFTDAIGQYQKAVEADPGHKNAHYNMGLAYYALKNYAETVRCCIAALRIDPRFSDARYMLSLAYFQQRQWNEAEREALELKKTDAKRGDEMLGFISAARKR